MQNTTQIAQRHFLPDNRAIVQYRGRLLHAVMQKNTATLPLSECCHLEHKDENTASHIPAWLECTFHVLAM
jgi:hypothetical protein